ncbi:testis anion transporter 1 isoform X7 [Rhinatrema bivittatum]|uniref:testis anion transporter 1 isoform X7 n=1 Tax=Rhinatrema bivittatum TaxID=194408 RepID=UPI00112CBE8D|nr:testis anion transporter 1 isoform X7 [Rhinatrema bivittatum]
MKDQCDIMEQSPEPPTPKTIVYSVNRNVYSEETFQRVHPKNPPLQKNITAMLKTYFSYSQVKWIDGLYKVCPFLYWIRKYQISWLFGDLISGINTGAVQIQQGMVATMLMKTPPINGIYSVFISSMIYVLLGTSRHICVGPYSTLHVMMSDIHNKLHYDTYNNVTGYNYTNTELEAIALTATTTFLAGIIQVILGCFHVGILTAYLSETLMSAYLTAAAVFIIVSQCTAIFGIGLGFHTGPFAIIYNLKSYMTALEKTNSANTLIFLICILLLWFSKWWKFNHKEVPIEFPMELLLIIAFTFLSSKFDLAANYQLKIAGMISIMPIAPMIPQFTSIHFILYDAFALAMVSYSILLCMGRLFAFKYGYDINSSQELIALGLCNIVGAFFRSFTISCTISRTIIQEKSGGSTQIAGLIAACIMLGVLMRMGPIFQTLPQAVLSAIVFVNIQPLLESLRGIPDLWKQDKYDFLAVDPEIIEECKIRALMKLDLSGCQDHEAANEMCACCKLCAKPNLQLTVPLAEYLRRRIPNEDVVPGVNAPGTRGGLVARPNNQVDFIHQHLWPTAMANVLESGEYREGPSRYLTSQYKTTPWLGVPSRATPCPCSRGASPELLPSQPHGESSKFQPKSPSPKKPLQLHTIILDFTMVNFIDSEAARLLSEVWYTFEEIEIKILFAGCNSSVIHDLERNNFFHKTITKAKLFLTVHDAVIFISEGKEISRRETYEDQKTNRTEGEGRTTPDVGPQLDLNLGQRDLDIYQTTFSYRDHSSNKV